MTQEWRFWLDINSYSVALVDAAAKEFGRIDVIVNNAGLMPLSPLEFLQISDWDQMINVNIKGVLYGIAAALHHMKEQKSGQIIDVSSVAGHHVGPVALYILQRKPR